MSELFDVSWDNFESLTEDNLRFVLELAEKDLRLTVSVYDFSIMRADSLIKLLVPFSSSWIVFAVYTLVENPYTAEILVPASVVGIMCLLVSLFLALGVFMPNKVGADGYKPNLLLNDAILADNLENRDKNYLFFVIEDYYRRIYKNDETNKKRTKRIKQAIYALIATPILSGVTLLITYLT
ncbi:MAG: hypothetical protein AAGC85_08780 [Bacteroidota bacterium]